MQNSIDGVSKLWIYVIDKESTCIFTVFLFLTVFQLQKLPISAWSWCITSCWLENNHYKKPRYGFLCLKYQSLFPWLLKNPKGRKSLNICDEQCLSWHKRVVRLCQLPAWSVVLKLSPEISPEIKSLWLMGWSKCLSLEFPHFRVRFCIFLLEREQPAENGTHSWVRMFGQCVAPVCVLLLAQALLELGEAWFFGILLALQQQEQVQGRSGCFLYTTAAEALLPWECGCWG